MEKLEKGYTKEKLSAFMQEAFKARKKFRRLEDGSWETQPAKPDIVSSPSTSVEKIEKIEKIETVETEAIEKPAKKSAWKQLKSFFKK